MAKQELDNELIDIIKSLEEKEKVNKDGMSDIEKEFLNWGLSAIKIKPVGATGSRAEKAVLGIISETIKTFMGFK